MKKINKTLVSQGGPVWPIDPKNPPVDDPMGKLPKELVFDEIFDAVKEALDKELIKALSKLENTHFFR